MEWKNANRCLKRKAWRLKIKVKTSMATSCSCGQSRIPHDARFCWACGKRYRTPEPPDACPCCAAPHPIAGVPYCFACGYSFEGTGDAEETAEERLRRMLREKMDGRLR